MARRVGAVAVLVALLLGLAAAAGWLLSGGRWARVETPSMGTRAPVGSLVWIRPAEVSHLRPGDLVTFHAPLAGQPTYTHAVDSITSDGRLRTRGQLSGPDGWTIGQRDLVGRVTAVWAWAGWLALMLPILIVGGLVVAGLSRRVPRQHRQAFVVIGATLVVSVVLLVHRPLTRADELSFRVQDHRGVAVWVNTGILPLRLSSPDGRESRTMRTGHVATVQVADGSDGRSDGRFVVHVRPHLPWWWWVIVALPCLLPAVIETLRRQRGRGVSHRHAAGGSSVASAGTESPQSSRL